ncbi:MAG: hypothetical protein IH618_12635, partial [Ignavibacteriaceae bacterium]|nr:hypothetical protein [Ignavibacteriaceae bacterium]
LEEEFDKLKKTINKSRIEKRRQYLKKNDFNENFFKRGIYVWIYNRFDRKRIIYIGTAVGKDGFFKRNKDHINNIFLGKGTFFSPSTSISDIYGLFLYDHKLTTEKYFKKLFEDKNIWIPESNEGKCHLFEKDSIENWEEEALSFINNCELFGLTFLNEEISKSEAQMIESYIQYKIIDFFNIHIQYKPLAFAQYYESNPKYSFWGKIEKNRENIPKVLNHLDQILEKYFDPIIYS